MGRKSRAAVERGMEDWRKNRGRRGQEGRAYPQSGAGDGGGGGEVPKTVADGAGVAAGFTAMDGAGVSVVDGAEVADADGTWVADSGSQAPPARRPISGEPPRSSLSLSPPFPSLDWCESDGCVFGGSATKDYLEHMLLDQSAKPTKLLLALLEAITNNFSDDQVIGRGGFAVVYKGMLRNGPIAVKKLSKTLDMQEKTFIQEVQCLMKLQHKNIVRFLGYCADTQGEMTEYEGKSVLTEIRNRVLCFEFVPNGSLHEQITGRVLESWRNRLEIPQQDTSLHQVRKCVQIGIMCVGPNPENRPITQYIMKKLNKELERSDEKDSFSVNGFEKGSHWKHTVANKEHTALVQKGKLPQLLEIGSERSRSQGKVVLGVRTEGEARPWIRDVPNGIQGEHVAAGWPRWLMEVAVDAVRGWQPRRADSFQKLDKIRQGTHSSTYKARDLENGKFVALNKVRFDNMDPESVQFMSNEIHILRKLDHPNVVKLEGLVPTWSGLYLVFEYMEHDLAGLLATPGFKLTEPQVKCFMQQLLSGLDHCHNRNVLHRNIKCASLLLVNNGILKIADFGLATFFNPNQNQRLTSRVVTLWYRPPELLLGATNYGTAVDLWSAGCILAELLDGKPIMSGRTEVEQLHKIFKLCGSPSEEFWANLKLSRVTIFKPQHPYRRCVNDVYKDFPTTALTLLDHLLAVEPGNRGTAASALDSEFFTTMPCACDPSSLPKWPPRKVKKLRGPDPLPAAASSSPASLSSLIRSCTSQCARRPGEQAHARAVELGLGAHPSVLPRLAVFYIALDDLPAARAAVERAAGKARAFPWNLLICGYADRGLWGDVVLACRRMLALGVAADRFTYPSVLCACGELRDASVVPEIEQRVRSWGYGLDMYVWNALVGVCAKCGEMEDARRVFDGMPARDVVSWNAIVSGYASAGMWGEAFDLLQWVPNAVGAGNLKVGNDGEVMRFVSQMKSCHGPGLDSVTVVIGLRACARSGYLKIGKELLAVSVRLGFDRLEHVESSLITMYSRCQMMSSAYRLFRTCSTQSVVIWNSLLAGFGFMDQVEEAILLFREMIYSSVFPNDVTLLTMLSLSARFGHLCHGREMHCYIFKHGLGASNILQNSLVDMYSKSRQMAAAQRVFDQMQCQDRHAYTSLILGYGMQREGHLSLKLFDEMIANNIKVDHVTMVAVLSACSHSGLVTQGQLRFAEMFDVFCIAPRVEHFSCMVDLYCREGLLSMAEEIINKMPFQPTAAMLATLIKACRIHGKTEVGDRAAKRMLAMRTNNPGHYKLTANMYISAKRWPELAKVRSLMSVMELNMIPTHSLLESEYDICPVEQDCCLNGSMHGGLSDDMTDTDFSSSEEVKCNEAFGG
ncbi:unnamed protein product [Miscanthus lutarioriparius]|uniref:Protein kinase domain-containing protein n=1 Tax=Miscanthus lutarioriparius TaxID=422564 RepID=A0A811R8C4_9POAL|nr:unnamed protein product [Miscanthus lutarioriparius]